MSLRSSLIVPSYLRVVDLSRCLAACLAQARPFDEIIVVARRDDLKTQELVQQVSAGADGIVRVVTLTSPGVIAAMQAGLDAVSPHADVICLTDDDAAPRVDWLERIVVGFKSDPKLAGIGGRDWQWIAGTVRDGRKQVVGRIQWFGRIVGNHHLGFGIPREVDLLKGVNCAFRANQLRMIGFDHRLLGTGAQVHWEMAICLDLKRRGWRLRYDPEIAVDHFIAKRADADANHRGGFHGASLADAAHNETLILLEHLGLLRRLSYLIWAALVGTREYPGIINLARLLLKLQSEAFQRWRSTFAGRYKGWQAYRKCHHRVRYEASSHTSPV